MTGGARFAAAVIAAVAVCLTASCTGSTGNPEETTMSTQSAPSSPAPGTSTEPDGASLCGFVPHGSLAQALGSSRLTSSGSLTGAGAGTTGACTISRADEQFPSVEVLLGPSVNNAVGPDGAEIRADVDRHEAGWYLFPAGVGVGYSHKQYEATVQGRKVTGALAYLDVASTVIGVRLLRPEPGRDAVADAAAIARSVAAQLALTPSPAPS